MINKHMKNAPNKILLIQKVNAFIIFPNTLYQTNPKSDLKVIYTSNIVANKSLANSIET